MSRLTQNSLPDIHSTVRVPTYDRSGLAPSWVHIGVGGFHRAHQAVYLNDLLTQGVRDWSLCGVGLLPHDRLMQGALEPQDCLYTIVERDADGDQARVIGSITRYLLATDDLATVMRVLANPQTRIVSLTITESGYDLTKAANEPGGAFGVLSEALERRRDAGLPPFTVLSCDNLPHNGDIAHAALLAASQRDPHLVDWIQAHVTCPNCMVDRITPQTTDADRALVRDEFGIDDAWPVVCEPFKQWIIEDKFCNGRPALEDVGVQFTDDVRPYELMKLRLLNASHSSMAYLGYLAGFSTAPEVMADPDFHRYISAIMNDEVTPLLAPVPGIDLTDYKKTLLHRFANPAIKDQITRLCLDGSGKLPKFILPSIRERLERGAPPPLLTLAIAGWMRYLSGTDEHGEPIKIEDAFASLLQERARAGGVDPRPLLGMQEIFGDLGQSAPFVELLEHDLQSLYAHGARVTLADTLSRSAV